MSNRESHYPQLISSAQVEEFRENGVLVLRDFYNVEHEITPIHRHIYRIIGLLIEKNELPIRQEPFSQENFDSGYQELLAHDRRLASEVYDAVKQIPAFVRLYASEKHDALFAQIRETDYPGTAWGGSGIRIDNPNEEKFRADWHQDYPAQFRSLDGIVFWSPLVRVTEELGPVRFCLGSHKDGLVPVLTHDAEHPEKSGAYALILQNRDTRVAKYPQVAPLTKPGDLVLIDFLALHASGYNRGDRSRWSMQMRYFNFCEPTGVRISWRGSFAAGIKIEEIHPELIVA